MGIENNRFDDQGNGSYDGCQRHHRAEIDDKPQRLRREADSGTHSQLDAFPGRVRRFLAICPDGMFNIDLCRLETDPLCHQGIIAVIIAHLGHSIDDLTAENGKLCHRFVLTGIGQEAHQSVKHMRPLRHKEAIGAIAACGKHNVIAFLDLQVQVTYLCRRVLQVTVQGHHIIASGCIVAGIQRPLLSEVPAQEDTLHVGIFGTYLADDVTTVVGTGVLDQNNLVTVGQLHHRFCDLAHQFTKQSGSTIAGTDY